MAVYNKFNQAARDFFEGRHNFSSNTFRVMLTNTAPVATNQIRADITEIAAGNGYTAGGPAVTMTVTISGGVARVTAANTTITATGAVGPFRYAVLYNDTQTTPNKPLLGYYDYGTAITLAATEQITITFDATNGLLQLQ